MCMYLQGVMSQSINWDLLEDQYLSDGVYREKLSKMVTIVDEAFLAGKKFARTYSENIDAIPTNAHTKIMNDTNSNCDRNVDITYKETKGANGNAQVVDISKNILDDNNKVPKDIPKYESFAQKENLKVELKQLLDEEKISQSLYNKLIANEKFELLPQDIEDINKLNEEHVKEVLLKCKIGE